MLFFMPILSIPLSGFGLLAGLWGVVQSRSGERVALRWSLIGCVLCAAVLGIGVVLVNAPVGELPSRAVPPQYPKPPDRPYVSPPADAGRNEGRARSVGLFVGRPNPVPASPWDSARQGFAHAAEFRGGLRFCQSSGLVGRGVLGNRNSIASLFLCA